MRGVDLAVPSASLRSWVPLRQNPVVYDGTRRIFRALVRHSEQARADEKGSAMSSRPLTADGDLLTAYLEDLKLHDYAPLLARLPTGTVHGASGERDASSTSLARFLIRVAQPMAVSQGITSMWTDMCQNSLDAPSDEEVHRVLHYCLCLHIVTRELAASPSLARSVLEHQRRALRQTTNWWMYLSAFEHAKLITLERALIFFSRHREGELPIPDNFGRIGLPFNILEAVLQDALIYRKFDNAWAGVPLILARPGRAGRPASLSDDGRRAVRMHLPLADQWKDLYVSWNLAFTASYKDAPYFSAALLCPCILGATPDEFMYHRTFALHLHASAQIRARCRLGVGPGERVQAMRDWAKSFRLSGLTDAWGARNLRTAHSYFAEVAPLQGWVGEGWHRDWAIPLIQAQRERTSMRGVVSPLRAARKSTGEAPLLRSPDEPPPPSARAALAFNVVGLGFAVAAVTPLALAAVAAPIAEAALVATSAAV